MKLYLPFFVLVLLMAMAGCASPSPTAVPPTLTPTVPPTATAVLPTPAPLPDFLDYVLPAPGTIYTLAEFNEMKEELSNSYPPGEVFFSMHGDNIRKLLEEGDNFFDVREFLPRINMTINGEVTPWEYYIFSDSYPGVGTDPVTGETTYSPPGGVPFGLSYPLEGHIGVNTMEIEITKTSGEIARYSWSILITE